MAKEFDVVVMSAALDKESDVGSKDIGVADAVATNPGRFSEIIRELTKPGEKFAYEDESAVSIDFFVGES